MGNHWTLQDAVRRFPSLVQAARRGEAQHVDDAGLGAVVVLSAEEYERLTARQGDLRRQKDFVQHLLEAPKLPEEFENLFDKREPFEVNIREINVEE